MRRVNKTFDKEDYSKKLKDPRWQKKRLEILQRDDWTCRSCGDKESSLHVHHFCYKSSDPWVVSGRDLITLCDACHERESIERFPVEKRLLKELKKLHFLVEDLEEFTEHFSRANEYFDKLNTEEWAMREKSLIEKSKLTDSYFCIGCYGDDDLIIHHKYIYTFKNPINLADEDFDFVCKECRGNRVNYIGWEWELPLIQEIRRAGFRNNDLLELTQGFFSCKPIRSTEVFVSMLRLLLEDEEFQSVVDTEYFKYLSLLNEKRERCGITEETQNEN